MAIRHCRLNQVFRTVWPNQQNHFRHHYIHDYIIDPSFKEVTNKKDTYCIIISTQDSSEVEKYAAALTKEGYTILFKSPAAYNTWHEYDPPHNYLIIFEYNE